VTKRHEGRHASAFGVFNRPIPELRSELAKLREQCRQEAFRLTRPFSGKTHIDRLRHLYAHALQLDVTFQPIKGWFPIRDENGTTHSSSCQRDRTHRCSCYRKKIFASGWRDNPVWGIAPNRALEKARAFCSLLNVVVSHGYQCDISRLLERLAINIWQMSIKDFRGLCRKITAKIAEAVRVNGPLFRKSPEPAERFSALTANPANPSRVTWLRTTRADRKSDRYIPRYVPPHRRGAHYCADHLWSKFPVREAAESCKVI